jgi:tellurite resistance protein
VKAALREPKGTDTNISTTHGEGGSDGEGQGEGEGEAAEEDTVRRAQSPDDLTQPTGFDPEAARLFEAIVESAYLVANADGEFDAAERQAFQHVVVSACEGRVGERQIVALLADLSEQLGEDGIDNRIGMVARGIQRADHAREVLRVAALLAQVSGGTSDIERSVLDRLAGALGLDAAATTTALDEARAALSE